jgi:hypothetical protein
MISSTPFGPGTLTLGDTASVLDASCQVENAKVNWDSNKDDDVTMLCGDILPGATTLTATLAVTVVQDLAADAGLVQYSYDNRGLAVPFEFVPSTDVGFTVSGTVTMVPIAVGADEPGVKPMVSDIEWACIGEPVYASAAAPLAASAADGD